MGPVKAYFAIMKAYCSVNVLLLPMTWTKGGYMLSPFALIFACFFEGLASVKLAQVAIKHQVFSYPGVAELAFGPIGRTAARILIGLASFHYASCTLTFTMETLQSMGLCWFGSFCDHKLPLWTTGVVVFLVYSRAIGEFSEAQAEGIRSKRKVS